MAIRSERQTSTRTYRLSPLRTKICARRPSAPASLIERLIDARTTRNLVDWRRRRTSYDAAAGLYDDVRSRQRWIVPSDSRLDYEVSSHLRLFYTAPYFVYGEFRSFPYGLSYDFAGRSFRLRASPILVLPTRPSVGHFVTLFVIH